jgi:3-methylcrotonyl-CoA carboxylase alpha subunit
MRVVHNSNNFETLLEQAKGEAMSSFADNVVLLERYITNSRHIEFQIFGDKLGNVIHLYERDCSVQRRNQKIIEESPAPGMTQELREQMGKSAVAAAKAVGYVGAGTVEFIFDVETNEYFFMEMNTRLQVEHPVTEMVTKQDLVQWQLHVAAGHPLPLSQKELVLNGHAIESRIYAENTEKGFLPSVGQIVHMSTPYTSQRIRIDTGIRENDEVSMFYDPMIAKLIVWGEDRNSALENIEYALSNFQIVGLSTNIDFLLRSVTHDQFKKGEVTTSFIPENQDFLLISKNPSPELIAFGALGNILLNRLDALDGFWSDFDGFRMNSPLILFTTLENNDEKVDVSVEFTGRKHFRVKFPDLKIPSLSLWVSFDGKKFSGTINGKKTHSTVIQDGNNLTVFTQKERFIFQLPTLELGDLGIPGKGAKSPMPGKVVEVFVREGQKVLKNELLCLMEAMKMRHEIRSETNGIVKTISYKSGDFVESDQLLVEISEN